MILAMSNSSSDTIGSKQVLDDPDESEQPITGLGHLSSQFQYILAIDLGTMYSGYAYAHKDDLNLDIGKINDICCPQSWNSGRPNPISYKTSTCILLDRNKDLDSFGFETENKYVDIVTEGRQDKFYFFRRFKLVLYEKKITPDLSLTDAIGKRLPAKLVFAKSIYALTHDFLKSMKQRGISIDGIRYVLTVPAIWSDAAKQLMREAAIEAGIKNEDMLLVLEPEAASIYNQFVRLEGTHDLKLSLSQTGTRYLVADLGAGTVDIAVHEKLTNGFIKEIHRCRGDDCGGDNINSALIRELTRIFGAPVLNEIKEKDPSMVVELHREFEYAKKTVDGKHTKNFKIRLPYNLNNLLREKTDEELHEMLTSSPHGSEMYFERDCLCISQSLVIEVLFEPTKDKIIQLLNDVILEVEGSRSISGTQISKILLVGGFSDSKYIQNAVRKTFTEKQIVIPESAELCVLKGAVLFGHSPHLISHRVVRFTYGIKTSVPFNPKEHDERHKIVVDGNERCDNLFFTFVSIGSVIEIGTRITKTVQTAASLQKVCTCSVFKSLSSNPKYTDGDDCEEVGKLTVVIQNPTEELRNFDIRLLFGNTDIQVFARDSSTRKVEAAKIDFILY